MGMRDDLILPKDKLLCIDLLIGVNGLFDFLRQFEAAKLLNECSSQLAAGNPDLRDQIHLWHSIAGRDGSVTLANFGRLLKDMSSCAKDTPELRALIDFKAIGQQWRQFEKIFPQHYSLRSAVVHAGEELHPSKRPLNVFKGSIKNPWIEAQNATVRFENCSMAGEFIFTWHGNFVSYKLNNESLDLLDDIFQSVANAFENVFPNLGHAIRTRAYAVLDLESKRNETARSFAELQRAD